MEKRPILSEESSEFDKIIKHILEIDEMAAGITSKALDYRKEAEKNIIKQKEELRQKYLERAEKRIDKVKTQERKIADDYLNEVETKNKQKLIELEKIASFNTDKWVSEIYDRVTSV